MDNEIDLKKYFFALWNMRLYFLKVFTIIIISYWCLIFFQTNLKDHARYIKLPLIKTSHNTIENNINLNGYLTSENIQKAIVSSGFSNLNVNDLKRNLTFISGSNKIENLSNYFDNEKFEESISKFYLVDLPGAKKIISEIKALRSNYVDLSLKLNDLKVNDLDSAVILEKIVYNINLDIENTYDVSGKKIKVLNTISLEETKDFNTRSMTILYNRYLILKEYINQLSKHYNSNVKSINTDDLKTKINIISYNLRSLIQSSEEIYTRLMTFSNINREIVEDEILLINSIISDLNKKRSGMPPSSNDKSEIQTTLDKDVIDRFLTLGEEISNNEFIRELLSMKLEKGVDLIHISKTSNEIFNTESGVYDFNKMELDDIFNQTKSDLASITSDVNSYIVILNRTLSEDSYLQPISKSYIEKNAIISNNTINRALLGVFFALLLSFAITLYKYPKNYK